MKYICTHTDFTLPQELKGEYTILSTKQPLDKTYPYPIIYPHNEYENLQYNYAEGYMLYDIYKNHNYSNTDKWVAINHYRRYIDYTPERITLPLPMLRTNMHEQYRSCHNLNHLIEVENIIREKFPQYSMDFASINVLYPCNMFQMPLEDFNEYINFQFTVLDEFNRRNNLYTRKDVEEYVQKTSKGYVTSINLNYQSRLQGFLMERIGTIFFLNHFKGRRDIEYKPINLTGHKIIL